MISRRPWISWRGSSLFSPAAPSSHLPRENSTPATTPRSQHRSKGLRPGERAWITFEEGRPLFSAMDDQYAFGELDEPGKLNLGAFAADHYVELDFRPIEGRIYFTRPAPPDFRKKGRPRRPKFWRLPKEGHLDRTPLDPAHRINSPCPWGRWAYCLVSRVFLPPA